MNEIEKMFYQAYRKFEENSEEGVMFELEPQQVVGVYKVDFLYGKCAVEIDGHEHHKTKEQREYDYKRERYLYKNGYFPIRFMGTEVFLDADSCVKDMIQIGDTVNNIEAIAWVDGLAKGKEITNVKTV